MDNGGFRANIRAMETDVLIIGGGLNGAALALALTRFGIGAVVVDGGAPVGDGPFDGRAYSISQTSRRLFSALGVWAEVEAQPIRDILVSDGRVGEAPSPLFLHFNQRDAEGGFGHMVEDRLLRRALRDGLNAAGVEVIHDARVAALTQGPGWVEATLPGRTIRARCAVGCDGVNGITARSMGVRRTGWDYGQWGLVCAVETTAPHHGVAHELFLPAGPFAILPLTGNRASLVWTETAEEAARLSAAEAGDYLAALRERFGDFLGEVRLIGPRHAFPLKLSLADRYCAPRLALVGEAAHAVHPIAGQGLNLGLRDVAALADVLRDAARRGEDIGAVDVLERYQTWRRFECTAMALGMDALNRLFANDAAPLRLLRDVGLVAFDAVPPLKRLAMRQAAGLNGDVPSLMAG